MVFFRMMNSNKIRRENGYCKLEDIDIINKDILTIVNKLNGTNFAILDMSNPIIANTPVTYISCDNIYGWGIYPLYMAYNDLYYYMLTKSNAGLVTNNFLSKVEEITIEPSSRHRVYAYLDNDRYSLANIVLDNSDVGYEIVYNYLAYVYSLYSIEMMVTHNPRIMVFHSDIDGYLYNYILTAGFNPYLCSSYFSSSKRDSFNASENNELPSLRSFRLFALLRRKLGVNSPSMTAAADENVVLDSVKNNKIRDMLSCIDYVKNRFEFENLGKYPSYDDYEVDQENLNIIKNSKPGVLQVFVDKDGKTKYLNSFTHMQNVRMDYRYFDAESHLVAEAKQAELMSKPLTTPSKEDRDRIRAKCELISQGRQYECNSYFSDYNKK